MSKKFIKLSLLTVFWLLFFVLVSQSQAAGLLQTVQEGGLNEIGITGYGTATTPQDPRVFVARIINIAISFLGIIFTVLTVYAGFQWMTSGGDSGKIDNAKKRLSAGIIGLVIVLASWGISSYVANCVWYVAGNDPSVWSCPGR